MNMIRQNNVAAYLPVRRGVPSFENEIVHRRVGEQRGAFLGAYGYKRDHGTVAGFDYRTMRGTMSLRQGLVWNGVGHPCGPAGAGPSSASEAMANA